MLIHALKQAGTIYKEGLNMGKATQDLKKEHEAIVFVLGILDAMAAETSADGDKLQYRYELIDFLKTFADKCHHGKEETLLFKAMEENGIQNEGGPIGVMLEEHIQGRGYIAKMKESLDEGDIAGFNSAAEQYCGLLRIHINKENIMLFKFADQVLDEAKQDELFIKFQEHEETVIGHGVHEQLHAKVGTWAKVYNVNDD